MPNDDKKKPPLVIDFFEEDLKNGQHWLAKPKPAKTPNVKKNKEKT